MRTKIIFILSIFSSVLNKAYSVQLSTDCPQYVLEGERLECTCTAVLLGNFVGDVSWSGQPSQSGQSTLVKDTVQRADNGTSFTCSVTVGEVTETLTYILLVACPPVHPNPSFKQYNSEAPPELTEYGQLFVLESYPVPTSYTYRFHGNSTSGQGQSLGQGQSYDKDSFVTSCQESVDEEYLVMCEVKIVKVTQEDFGLYSVSMANGFGTFEFYFIVQVAADSPEPQLQCPFYVAEGDRLECLCTATNVGTSAPTVTWSGPSEPTQLPGQSLLVLDSVSRADNGKQYTCTMSAGAVTKTVVFTLQVAYGPYSESTAITGPGVFTTNGSQEMTLTCASTEVNPEPKYFWSGVPCLEKNQASTCTFKPQPPDDDGITVTCTVSNSFIGGSTVNSASAVFTLSLQYPPHSAPVIETGVPGRSTLIIGDTLTCTVSGGKPPLSSLQFSCSNPELPDQADSIAGDTISSTLVVNVPKTSPGDVTCSCDGVWSLQQDLYPLTAQATFSMDYTGLPQQSTVATVSAPTSSPGGGNESQSTAPPKTNGTHNMAPQTQSESGSSAGAVVGGVLAALIVIAVIVVVVIIILKKRGLVTLPSKATRYQQSEDPDQFNNLQLQTSPSTTELLTSPDASERPHVYDNAVQIEEEAYDQPFENPDSMNGSACVEHTPDGEIAGSGIEPSSHGDGEVSENAITPEFNTDNTPSGEHP